MSNTRFIRSAFWVGAAKPGARTRFEDFMNHELMPTLRQLPGVHAARSLWPTKLEDQPPNVACQVLVEFTSHEDFDRMLASPERQAMRAKVKELLALFDGAVSHIEYDVGP